jgi:DNA polymerase
MDAREALRRYLEQRRELGESELVLDSLSVDEALKLLGAKSTAASPVPSAARSAERGAGATAPAIADWREAIRAAGGAPVSVRPSAPPPAPETVVPNKDFPHALDKQNPVTASSPLSDVPAGLTVGGSSREAIADHTARLDTLDAIAKVIAGCTRCSLYSTAKNPVPGTGNPNADFMCVGEAPGANEDEQGVPFVGQAGQLLTKILEAIKLGRDDVFIANVLKHRPPGNRNPLPEEVTACSPYLVRQIELVKPKVILALGTFAAQTLLETKLTIGKLRGQVHRYYGVPLVVTYHPAALLRNPAWKRPTWEDVQLARRILDSAS